ncbi:MAG: phosphoadenosine phosphosulfate reductase domain-containing protein [Verrucomicrobiia bacterium]
MNLTEPELKVINTEMESLSAEERIAWAWDRFGAGLVLSTSFGLQSSVMLDLVLKVSKEIPVIFIDTGYLFAETYRYALTVQERFGFRVRTYSAKMSPAFQEVAFGKLWEQGTDEMKRYNFINKKEPMERALNELGATAWLSGLQGPRSETVYRESGSGCEILSNS